MYLGAVHGHSTNPRVCLERGGLSSLHGFVSIGYLLGKLHVAIDGTTRAVEMAGRGRLPDGDYFVALVAAGGPPAIKAIPCWSTAD